MHGSHKKNELCLSVNVFSWKILIDKMGNVFLGLQLETKENCHFTRASEPRKGSTFISQLF